VRADRDAHLFDPGGSCDSRGDHFQLAWLEFGDVLQDAARRPGC
jgi:hypothetical protein